MIIQIVYDKRFKKHFCKRVPDNPKDPILINHELKGTMKNHWAFSIKGDFRAVYYWQNEDVVVFTDIGTHNQVYGR